MAGAGKAGGQLKAHTASLRLSSLSSQRWVAPPTFVTAHPYLDRLWLSRTRIYG
jgi:hypothetical protein